jgi:hypothetical protein
VEQRGEAAAVGVTEDAGPFRFGQGVLDHQGVYEGQAGLQDLQAQHGQFLFFAAVGGQLAPLAEVDVVVDAVVVLHDVQPGAGLALQVTVPQPAGQEDGPLGAAGLEHGGVGGVGDVFGEPAQDRLCAGGPQPDRGRVLDHRVVLRLDDVPADRPGQRGLQQRVGASVALPGQVQLHLVDLLEPGDQVEVQQPGDAEPDERGAVGIDVVGLDAHVGAVPHRALDHGVHLGGRALQELAVNRHRPGGVDCPVDRDAPFCPAVAGVPFGEDVLVEGRKVGGVGGYRSSALAPQPRVAGGEGGVRDRAGGIPARLDGDVAAADVAQVVFAVRVVARRDRPDPGVGAVGVAAAAAAARTARPGRCSPGCQAG